MIMKTKHFLYYLAVLTILFTACKDSDDYQRNLSNEPRNSVDESKNPAEEPENPDDDLRVTKEIFSGYAQKGPFINGSSVTILELKPNLDQTGRTYFTTIANNSGSFELKNVELNSHYANLKIDGYYFNEISGKTSVGQMTLYALVDVKDVNSANVNVLTHLEKPRVEYLVKQDGKKFFEAKQQAQREVLAIFGFEPPTTSSETLDLTDNAALLAISCILQSYLSTGDMMELMANIGADIEKDGVLDNMALGTKLMNNAYAISYQFVNVRNNLTTKYAELGSNATIPDFESYIRSFIDSDLYPYTPLMTYPETGTYGKNILSDAVTSVKKGSNYSMKADVPEGVSLKIVVKDGMWYYMGLPAPLNWSVNQYDTTNKRQEFTVMESGKSNDLNFIPDTGTSEGTKRYITIEYYENSPTIPTKVKKLYIEN
jgi:hypothetical protein